MKKLLLLTFICFTSLPSFAQAKTYLFNYGKVYEDGSVKNETRLVGESMVIDEAAKKITLVEIEGANEIFKIIFSYPMENSENGTVYACDMPSVSGGFARVHIYHDRFFKSIKIAGRNQNITGLQNFVQYQYK